MLELQKVSWMALLSAHLGFLVYRHTDPALKYSYRLWFRHELYETTVNDKFANTMKTLICATVLGLLTSFAAYAQEAKSVIPDFNEVSRKGDMVRLEQQKKKERFTAADEDGNGTLSHAELARHFPYIELNFPRYDLNKDGVLSWAEFSGRDK